MPNSHKSSAFPRVSISSGVLWCSTTNQQYLYISDVLNMRFIFLYYLQWPEWTLIFCHIQLTLYVGFWQVKSKVWLFCPSAGLWRAKKSKPIKRVTELFTSNTFSRKFGVRLDSILPVNPLFLQFGLEITGTHLSSALFFKLIFCCTTACAVLQTSSGELHSPRDAMKALVLNNVSAAVMFLRLSSRFFWSQIIS